MSSLFSKPKMPKLKSVEEPVETVQETPEQVQQRIRRSVPPGKQENLLYGLLLALKKRLGE